MKGIRIARESMLGKWSARRQYEVTSYKISGPWYENISAYMFKKKTTLIMFSLAHPKQKLLAESTGVFNGGP